MSYRFLLFEKQYYASQFRQDVRKTLRFLPRRIHSNNSSGSSSNMTMERKANNIQRYIDQVIFPIRGVPNTLSSSCQTIDSSMGLLDEFWLRNMHERRIITMRILLWLGLVWLIPTYLLDVDMPIGPSMLPTIHSCGDIVLIWRVPMKRNYRVGDIVQCRLRVKSPMSASAGSSTICPVVKERTKEDRTKSADVRYVIKRITRIIEDPDIARQERFVWIEGDCTEKSYDSRHYGPISESCIVGRVVLRVWPLGNMWFRPVK